MATIKDATTVSLDLEIEHDEGITEGDFVQVEGTSLVAQISHIETSGGTYSGEATIVGSHPKQPPTEGKHVRHADQSRILEALRLPDHGIHLGEIRGLDAPIHLDVDDMMSTQFGIFGRTGSGKSYTSGVVIEELLNADQAVVIIDPHGEYASLKLTPDGKPSDFKIAHYADTEFVPEADHELDLESIDIHDLVRPGQATIIDLLGIDRERETIVKRVLEELFMARKRERIPATKVVLEEAHAFASRSASDVRPVVEDILRMGRKFQFTVSMVSQRPSGIDTDIRSQLMTIALHKLTDDTDVDKAISITEGIDSGWDTQIQKLGTGECIVAGTLITSATFVDVRERQTMHHSGESEGKFSTADHADTEEIQQRQAELEEEIRNASEQRLRELVRRLSLERDIDPEDLSVDPDEVDPVVAERLRDRIEEQEETIEELRTTLERKDERIAELERTLEDEQTEQAETSPAPQSAATTGQRTPDGAQETPDRTQPESPASVGEDEPGAGRPRLDEPDHDPRPREVVLNQPHVESVVSRHRGNIRELDRMERKVLKFFSRGREATIEAACRRSGTAPYPGKMDEIRRTLETKGFVRPVEHGSDEYEYVLDTRIENDLSDTLVDAEIEYVIDEIEQSI